MAMVSRKERRIDFVVKSANTTGPGSYDVEMKLVRSRSPEAIITKPKASSSKGEDTIPGPGSYNPNDPFLDGKVVLSDEQEGLIVIENERNNAVFKSVTPKLAADERFADEPGPGYQQFPNKFSTHKDEWTRFTKQPKKELPAEKNCALQTLFSNANYQPAQSIPSKWSQNKQFLVEEEGELRILNERIIHTAQAERRANKKQNHKPGCSFTKTPSNRLESLPNNCQVGPGAYFREEPQLLRTYSKLAEEPRTTGFLQLLNKHQASHMSKETKENSFDEDQDISLEYVKESCPGPGSYDTSLSFGSRKSFNTLNKQKFGVTSKRFCQERPVGQPFRKVVETRPKKLVRRHDQTVAFGRKLREGGSQDQTCAPSELGPGSYNETRTLESKVAEAVRRTYQGRFGSNTKRFEEEMRPNEQQCFYDYNKDAFRKVKAASPAFRSTSPRAFLEMHKQNCSPSGFYSQEHNTIERKIEILREAAMDEVCKKPGFNMSMTRFTDLVREKQIIPKPAQSSPPKKPTGFSIPSAETKPLSPARLNPGPGQYDFVDRWNSKTFNILYI